ncbi:unnamed protein product [Effrenium voratum]|nr:unnamed protein product [Effrenium voratum]
MSGVRAAQSAKKLLKVRTGGLRVGLAEDEKYSGTTFGVSGASDVKVVWDDIENMGWGEYPTGTDKDGNESFALTLLAAHSYLMITGCGGPEAADDANVLSGLYVMDPSSFLPSYYQYEGVGRLCYQEEEEKWILFNKMEGCMLNWYYECESETLDVPEKGWCVLSGWDEEYANPPSITKHELQEGQDVKLRKLHPDAHIPADKYPGEERRWPSITGMSAPWRRLMVSSLPRSMDSCSSRHSSRAARGQ